MQKITKFFIDNYKLATILTFLVIFIGVIGLKNITAETNPPVNFATAVITTTYPGASARDIEIKITKPIEDEIRNVSDIKDVRSVSQAGVSTIVIRLDMDKRGIDIPARMADLQRYVDRAELPADLDKLPVFTEIKSDEIPVLTIAVIGSNENRRRNAIADLLKDNVENNKDVKGVTFGGFNERQFNIKLDVRKMRRASIGINELIGKIKARNIDIPSGEIKYDKIQLLTRIEAKIKNVDELREMVIRANFSGKTIRLKDVAEVLDGEEEPKFITRYNGEPATILTITKKSATDSLKIISSLKEQLAIFEKDYPDYRFFVVEDESKRLFQRLSILVQNAVIGLGVVLVCLFCFLPFRVGFHASLSLPISILATIGTMYYFGVNINTLTIIALVIVLGMLVDDSVIISENFTKHYHEGMEPRDAVLHAIKRLWLPIAVTVFTTIAAFLPMLVTKGIMGEFIKWIPIIVSLALLLSLVECYCLLPMRLAHYSGKKRFSLSEQADKDWFHRFELLFEKFILRAIKLRYLMLLAFFGVIYISGYFMFVANKFVLFPAEQTENYLIRVKSNEGTRLERTAEILDDISLQAKEILQEKAEHIVAKAGAFDVDSSEPTYSEGSDVGHVLVYVNDFTKYNISSEVIVKELKKIKPVDVREFTVRAAVNGPPVGNDIEVSFKSNVTENIDRLINLVKADLSKIPGIYNLEIDDIFAEDEVFLNINYDKLERLGLSVSEVGEAIKAAIAGVIVSKVTLDNKEVDLFVELGDRYKNSINDIYRIKVKDSLGNLVPIRNFVTLKKEDGSPFIKRYDYKRSKTLLGSVDTEVISAMEANKKLKEIYNIYKQDFPDVALSYGGSEESTNESLTSLRDAFLISVILIFALLVFLFRSYSKPFIILTTIPLGLLGFSIAFYVHQKPISFMAVIGLVGLSGVIVNAGIVLISYIVRFLEERKDLSFAEVLAHASSLRIRSVTITTITTIAGLAPTAYGVGGSDAILSPMTLTIMWGLAAGTILTIIWIPCLIAIEEDIKRLFSRKKKNL